MTTWLTRTTIAVLLMSVTPSTASAQFWDIVKWINDMSGPQMTGWAYEQSVWCQYDSGVEAYFYGCSPFKITQGRRTEDRRSITVAARVGRTWNTKIIEGDRDVRDISMFLVGPSVRWSPKAAPFLDVSGGVELVRFYGPTVDAFWVTTIDPGLTLRPLQLFLKNRRLSYVYSLGVTYKQFLETFGGAPFGAAPNSFQSETEGMWQVTLARFDLSTLIFR